MTNLDFLNDRGQRILWGSQYAMLLEKPLFYKEMIKFIEDHDTYGYKLTKNKNSLFLGGAFLLS